MYIKCKQSGTQGTNTHTHVRKTCNERNVICTERKKRPCGIQYIYKWKKMVWKLNKLKIKIIIITSVRLLSVHGCRIVRFMRNGVRLGRIDMSTIEQWTDWRIENLHLKLLRHCFSVCNALFNALHLCGSTVHCAVLSMFVSECMRTRTEFISWVESDNFS